MYITSKVTFFLFIFLPGAVANYHLCPRQCQCYADPIEHSRAIHLICKWEQVNTTNLEALGRLDAVRTLTIRCPHNARVKSSPPPRFFANLRNLDRLEIDRCKMADLPERLFEGMSQLYSLIIKNADLEQIPPTLFRPLSNLMALDLTGNKLRIEPQALGSLTNLIQLDMSNNSIPFLANTLASLHHLKILEMDHNELTNIDFRRFPPSLTDLSLRHNSINTIHFINESVSQLRRLDLSGNALENVASTGTVNVFPHSIRLLDISFNRISYITDNAFAHLQKLTTIDIRNNHLTEIKETALRAKANEQRRQVFVSGNPLKCSCSIQWMIHPENKEIPLVMDASQATCTSLVHLDANMSLSEAYSSQQFLCKYQSECLEGCECCLRPLGECRCQSTCPPGCTCWRSASASLRVPGENVVSCHRVRIDRLTPIPTMVTELHFPDVRMDAIGIDAIGRRDHLVLLNVSNSRISGLTQEALSQFPRLQTLDMSNTHIEALPHNALRSNPALTTLYLHDNKLKNIDLSVLSTLSSTSLKHLTLGGNRNQFTCSCTVPSDMQIWLLSSDTRKKISDFDDIQCKFDETNTMVYLYEIDPLQNGTLCVSMSTTSSTVSPTLDQTPSIGVSQSSRKASVTTKPFPTAATILTHSSEATLEEEEPPTDIILSTRERIFTFASESPSTKAPPRIRPTTRDSRPSRRNANTHAFMTIVIFLLLLTVVCLLFAIGSTVYYRFIRQSQSYIQKRNSAPRADEEVPLNL